MAAARCIQIDNSRVAELVDARPMPKPSNEDFDKGREIW
jgi:hypothetical protein